MFFSFFVVELAGVEFGPDHGANFFITEHGYNFKIMAERVEVDTVIDNLRNFKSITEKQVKLITDRAIAIFSEETNTVPVKIPVTICGDIHGQLHDLIELFTIGGDVPFTNYLFMGDFVDRGYYSV